MNDETVWITEEQLRTAEVLEPNWACEFSGFGVRTVVITGHGGFWFAYTGPQAWTKEQVAREGDKLWIEHAYERFPFMRGRQITCGPRVDTIEYRE